MAEDDIQPDDHSPQETEIQDAHSKAVDYVLLAIAAAVLMALVATGIIPVFGR